MAQKKVTKTSVRGKGLSGAEKAAMKETIEDQKRAARGESGESMLLAKIAVMSERDRGMAKRIHAVIKANAPGLEPTTWYGMPAYARNGKAVVFFQPADKFKARYATLGFNDSAMLDEGAMWPTSYALTELTAADEKKIGALVKKAAR